jgi:glycosyltransferase involved in cell wall biosynthesis
MKMKILFYDNDAIGLMHNPLHPSGGAAKQVLAWSKGLERIGIDTVIAGGHTDMAYFKDFPNIKILYDPEKGIRKFRYLYIKLPGIISGLFRIKSEYIYYGIPGAFAGLLALISKLSRKYFILRVSSNVFADGRYKEDGIFNYYFSELGFRLSYRILCQNTYQYNQLKKRYPSKTYKLKNPYGDSLITHPLPHDKRKYIMWIGRFRYPKNLPLLYEIVKHVLDVQFIVSGGISKNIDGESRIALEKLTRLPNVTMLGNIDSDSILSLLKESYVLLNTSHYEGFSNTFLEAFSVGTPVCTLPQNDPDDIIQSYSLGFIYTDKFDFIKKLNEIVNNKDCYNKLTANCLEYMKNNHDLIKQSQEFKNILNHHDDIVQYRIEFKRK